MEDNMPDLEKREKFLILSSLVIFSSYILYQSIKFKKKKNKKYSFLEAILVDSSSL